MTEPKKKLLLFLDGTWNEIGTNTNVWRLKSLCAPVDKDGCRQVCYYDKGVNGFFGGTFGKGLSQNVQQAYQWLIDHHSPNDEIFIFGFSRGAYTARSLAGLIAKHGLLKPGSPMGVDQLYERYRQPDVKTVYKLLAEEYAGDLKCPSLEERWVIKYSVPVPIKCVAVWDTVGALGVPFLNIKGVSRKTLSFLHTGLRIPIRHGFHAISIDENRASFPPTLWTVVKGIKAKPRPLESVEQRWFVGAHGNVGGGYHSDLLAQRPLQWIMDRAASLGVSFRYDIETNEEAFEAKIADSYREFLYGAYAIISGRSYRTIGAPPRTDDIGTHTTVNETIDGSVFERWRCDPKYAPPSLIDWAKRNHVDPTHLSGSVLAHDPNVLVSD